jgi:hypothetical protein
MASSERIDELKRKFDENPRRYFAPLANEFRKGGDLDQAILICQEFLPQQPGHMSGHIVYGQALFETGRIDDARGVFETALSLDPENLIALRHLGDIAARQGDPPSARRWYERVLEADPRNEEIQGLLANLESAPAADAGSAPVAYAPPEPATPPEPQTYAPEPQTYAPEPRDFTAVPADEPELLDLDVTMPDDSDRHAEPAGSTFATELPVSGVFDPTTIDDIESTPETADLMPATEGRAEGFEATEFTAPDEPVAQAEGLEAAFEVETGVHVAFFQTVSGLEAPPPSAEASSAHAESGVLPELDAAMPEDRGDVVPPHGDPIAESAVAPATTERDDSLLDFDMPAIGMPAGDEPAAPSQASEPSIGGDVAADVAAPAIPTELPPEVIAAEAELIDEGAAPGPLSTDAARDEAAGTESAGDALSFPGSHDGAGTEPSTAETSPTSHEPYAETSAPSDELHAETTTADEASAEPAPAEHRLFVTETMAELYLKQGLRPEALSVYEQLSSAAPGDGRLAARVASLREELASLAKASGPRVRDFFASFAVRRPGERAAASAPPTDDDFGPNYTDEFPTPPSSSRAVPAAVEHHAEATPAPAAAPTERTGGSIDARFGNQHVGAVEDSAASALAQAFAAESEATPLTGNPTRPASGELTLDSVFREGPRGARAAQGFSFDQFFSQNVEGDKTSGGSSEELPADGEPAQRSEDDIEQFNSWLQGLKQR